MSAKQLSMGLLFLGAVALSATTHLGSPWPGVALASLSLLPWGWDAWLMRGQGPERRAIDAMAEALNKHANKHLDVAERLDDHEKQINSLRNAVSLRGTLGG